MRAVADVTLTAPITASRNHCPSESLAPKFASLTLSLAVRSSLHAVLVTEMPSESRWRQTASSHPSSPEQLCKLRYTKPQIYYPSSLSVDRYISMHQSLTLFEDSAFRFLSSHFRVLPQCSLSPMYYTPSLLALCFYAPVRTSQPFILGVAHC